MKFLKGAILLFGFLLSAQTFSADIKANSEDGRPVILKDDGTWQWVSRPAPLKGSGKYDMSAKATKKYKTIVANADFFYDPADWEVNGIANKGHQKFAPKREGYFGAVIAENLPIGIESLKKLAISNSQRASNNTTEVLQDENRVVNGRQMAFLKFKSVIEGVDFVYYGNYYADDVGIVQVICGGMDVIDKKFPQTCPNFISGIKIN
jgi:hypothetical protein